MSRLLVSLPIFIPLLEFQRGLGTEAGVSYDDYYLIIPRNIFLVSRLIFETNCENEFAAAKKIIGRLAEVYDEVNNHTRFMPDEDDDIVNDKMPLNGQVYDFVIVGSGSAGSVVASRLSENSDWKVLLLEAGKIESPFSQIPLASVTTLLTPYNWKFLTEYQPNFAHGIEEHRSIFPRGRALGGSSVISNMIYGRGNPADYNEWAEHGNPGWSYKDVLPYFLKIEGFNYSNHIYHGKVNLEHGYVSDLVNIFMEAGSELGYKKNIDYNTPHQLGFALPQFMMIDGRRQSTAKSYLFPAIDRENLDIVTKAYVTKILIDPISKTAHGVEYYKNGRFLRAFADKEVILSAGVINSPQLLMLSGVGPKHHLHDLSIDVIKDLPVGENFQDHVGYFGNTFLVRDPLTYTPGDIFNFANIKYFLKTGEGPYRSAVYDAIAFLHANSSESSRPEIELIFQQGSPATDFGVSIRKFLRIRNDVYRQYWAPLSKTQTFTILTALLHPKSKGSIRLRSADPFSYPLIYGNFLSDPENEDVKTLIDGIRVVLEMSKTKSFHDNGIYLHNIPVPGCDSYTLHSDDYWECALRTFSVPLSHGVGTVKMGPHEHPKSVVDHELKVYGIRSLRVVDSSVIPFIPGNHIAATVIMVGEKASEMIKQEWKTEKKKN